MSDFEREPVRGLPGFLPAGEKILWQGAPNPWSLGRRALMIGPVLAYFAVLAVWRFLDAMSFGAAPIAALEPVVRLVPFLLGALVILMLIGRWIASTTLYTITNKRVVLRFGVALPMAINLPFKEIGSADLKIFRDGTGSIALSTLGNARLAYLHLWPSVRPWYMSPVQPSMRSIEEPEAAAQILGEALRAYHEQDQTLPIRVAHRPEAEPETAGAIPAAT
ncbi:MAG: photosynthetic complex putative assembly protein PuhB [Pseudomonadota bacterium]